MAVRNDITIEWELSPRKITIDSPSTTCSMQDLLDTLRYREALSKNCDNLSIVDASGKETLNEDGDKVGITVTLLNATIGFETRPGPDWVQCYLDGGNVAGQDVNGEPTSFTTHNNPFVNITKTSSVSATITEGAVDKSLDYDGVLVFDAVNGYAGQDHPFGTRAYPTNNIDDGIAIATQYGLSDVLLKSDLDLDRDVMNWSIKGQFQDIVFSANGFKANRCSFHNVTIEGDFNDSYMEVHDAIMGLNVENIYGNIKDVWLGGRILIAAGQNINIADSESSIAGNSSPVIDMHQGADTTLSLRAKSGGMTITNCDTPNCIATLEFIAGKPHLEPSNTDGFISVRGTATLDDRSDGTLVDTSSLIDPALLRLVLDILEGDVIPKAALFKILHKDTKAELVVKTATTNSDELIELTE